MRLNIIFLVALLVVGNIARAEAPAPQSKEKGEHKATETRPAATPRASDPNCAARWRVGLQFNATSKKLDVGPWTELTDDQVKQKPHNIYARWDSNNNSYMWVAGNDAQNRPILSGTKVQGWRLGITGPESRNWFRLSSQGWVKDTDANNVPSLQVANRFGNAETIEVAPTNWQEWGETDRPQPRANVATFPSSGVTGFSNTGGPAGRICTT